MTGRTHMAHMPFPFSPHVARRNELVLAELFPLRLHSLSQARRAIAVQAFNDFWDSPERHEAKLPTYRIVEAGGEAE